MRNFLFSILVALACWLGMGQAYGQAPVTPPTGNPIDIIHADSISLKKVNDSTSLTILEGGVIMKQGHTTFKCDRCVKNDREKTFEAWGNVHIIDSDTTHIYSGHLKYLTDKQIAYLDKNVKLTDGHVILTTPDLEYNMTTHIANYKNGGKVVNKKTVITSKEAFYYTDIKDVYFKRNVFVNDPVYKITTDSLMYNTENQTARFIAQTDIRDSANKTIKTREGFYNLKSGDAQFGQRPIINDGKQTTIIANNVTLNNNIAKAEGNAIIVDSIRGTTIIGNLIYQNRNTEAILATQHPLMIIKQGNDSIYITADTLFSAKLTDLYIVSPALGGDSIKTAIDTVLKKDSLGLKDSIGRQSVDSLNGGNDFQKVLANAVDGSRAPSIVADSLRQNRSPNHLAADSLRKQLAGEAKAKMDSVLQAKGLDSLKGNLRMVPQGATDSIRKNLAAFPDKLAEKIDTLPKNILSKKIASDTASKLTVTPKAANDSTNRYFEAFHNVKIFTDSVQAVSDSLFYSFKDSIFRLYQDPVVWGKGSQITGDTLLLHTKNKQLYWFEAFKKGFMIHQTNDQAYNQISATRLDGFFTNGTLDSVRAKGNSKAIYFVQDDDSAYVGINQTQSDILDAYFMEKALKKIVLRSNVTGTFFPIRQKTPDEMRLEGFEWREAIRPKTKFELMQ